MFWVPAKNMWFLSLMMKCEKTTSTTFVFWTTTNKNLFVKSITLIWYPGIWDPPTYLLGHRGPPSLRKTAENKRVICPYRLACPWGKKDPREEDIGFALHFKTTAVTYSCEGLCLFILPHQQLTKCEHQYVVRRRIFHKFAQTHLHYMLWLQSRHSRQFFRTTIQRSYK